MSIGTTGAWFLASTILTACDLEIGKYETIKNEAKNDIAEKYKQKRGKSNKQEAINELKENPTVDWVRAEIIGDDKLKKLYNLKSLLNGILAHNQEKDKKIFLSVSDYNIIKESL